jgi:hypothetical protein
VAAPISRLGVFLIQKECGMLKKLDTWLIEILDKAATKAQRHGILLTSIHVTVMGALLITATIFNFLYNPALITIFGGAVWGSWLFVYIKWANENKDYPHSIRMMEKLNAKAIYLREQEYFTRLVWLSLLMMMILFSPIGYEFYGIYSVILGILSIGILPALAWYLNGSTFLGPGHFAKAKQTAPTNASFQMDV